MGFFGMGFSNCASVFPPWFVVCLCMNNACLSTKNESILTYQHSCFRNDEEHFLPRKTTARNYESVVLSTVKFLVPSLLSNIIVSLLTFWEQLILQTEAQLVEADVTKKITSATEIIRAKTIYCWIKLS